MNKRIIDIIKKNGIRLEIVFDEYIYATIYSSKRTGRKVLWRGSKWKNNDYASMQKEVYAWLKETTKYFLFLAERKNK